MSKIKIKTSLKNKEGTHEYVGNAIKKDNTIIYNDGNIITKVNIDNIITIERKEEYKLIIKLKEGINLKGSYITKYGSLKVDTYTKEIIKDKKSLKITYDLKINDEYIDTFIYNLQYTIDSK